MTVGARVLVVTICAAAVAAASAAGAQVPLGQSVTDVDGRFTISVPSSWQVQRNVQGLAAMLAVAPAQRGDRVPANVNVVVEALPVPLAAADYAAKAEVMMKTAFHNYAVVQQGDTAVGGRPAYYRYYTWDRNDGVGLYQVQAYLTVNQTGFVVTGTTGNIPDRIRRDVPLLVQIINTFRPASTP